MTELCTPACQYWNFGQDPACSTISVGGCKKYDCPTQKLGSCPPRGYSDLEIKIKRNSGLGGN